jgi:large subunit ribosomal protein L25
MSADFILHAEKRAEQGKGASRRLRHTGKLPAIVYGAGKEPAAITLEHNEILRHLQEETFYSQILTVDLDGAREKVVLRDLQRHPAKALVLHLDLQRIDEKEEIRVSIPIHFLNQDTSPGVKLSGQVSHQMIEIEISCLPKDLPEFLELDMGEMNIGDSLHLSDLKVPEGIQLTALIQDSENNPVIVSIHAARSQEADEETTEDTAPEQESGATEEGAGDDES